MSTIASLISQIDPSAIKPWYEGQQGISREQIGRQQAQTGLITLADLKQKQASEALLMERIQNDPRVQQALFGGGSTIGSLQTAPGGVGAPQMVPGGQDLSRFANVPPQGGGPIPPNVMAQTMPHVTPPQGQSGGSVLASLGGQPQGPMQGPQNPLLEMARRDPRAAMMLQQQMQASQDRQWKMQEQQLGMGVKVAEFVARELQGVTDQASLDQARERIRQVHPQAAAQVPQMYSKEGIATVHQRGIAISDMALWKLNMAKARKANVEAEMLPKLLEQEGVGGTTPAGDTAPTTTGAPGAGTAARTAPPEFESAITDANRLYPQVSTTRIKSIIAAESNFDPKAVSSAGAKGPMQLLDGTAKEMGVDDPFNVQQNVRGGTRYYAQMLTKYGGDERKALAAYNWGPGNLDKVNGDVSKAPPETQAYVNRVLGGGGAGGGTGTAGISQAPPEDSRVPGLRAQIRQGQAKAKQYALLGYESMVTQYSKDVDDLQKEVDRLEAPRHELAKQTVLQPGVLAQQRAGAEVQLEAEMNKPIGAENAQKMGLDPQTRWKDVPKGTRVLDRPPEGVSQKFGDYKASYEGLGRVMGMLDKPGARSIVGTLLSEPDASFRRRAGEWVSSVTPEERKFAAALVGEIATIRNTISGQAVSEQEAEFLRPMLPSVADPDVGTVRAKLEALQEWVARKHEGYRDQQDQMGFRTPKPLARAEGPPVPKPSTAVDKARDIMKPR